MPMKNRAQVKQSISNIQNRLQTLPKGSPEYANAQMRLEKHQGLLKTAPRDGGRPMPLPSQAAPQAQAQPMPRPQMPMQEMPQQPMPQQINPAGNQMPSQAQAQFAPDQMMQKPMNPMDYKAALGDLGATQGQPMQNMQTSTFPMQRPMGGAGQQVNPQVADQVFEQIQGGVNKPAAMPLRAQQQVRPYGVAGQYNPNASQFRRG